VRPPSLRCPRCKGALRDENGWLACGPCGARYPIVLGIPDLRVCPDPYIDFDTDRAKARQVAACAESMGFEELLHAYWAMTPETPREAAERYVLYASRGVERAQSALALVQAPPPGGALLDLGTGTGGLLVAGRQRFAACVGIDVALRWLVIARRRLEEHGIDASLVCACADHLPFAPQTFDAVCGLDFLQHVADPARALSEAACVLRAAGEAIFTTTNRLSLLPDPHTRLVGTGFLPRRWWAAYVRWRGRAFDPGITPPSVSEARRLARVSFRRVEVLLPPIGAAEASRLSPGDRRRAAIYEHLRQLPLARQLLLRFGPLLALRCREPRGSHGS
jgi:SAM-dependent methyltransferase